MEHIRWKAIALMVEEIPVADEEQLKLLRQGVEVWNEWRESNPDVQIDLGRANLIWANLSGANLSRANLSEADLSVASLSRANLSGADLRKANLSGVNLQETDLSRVHLSEANLSEANMRRANLSEANMRRANLSRANLSEAELNGAYLSGANFSRANLSEANFSRANLSEAELNGVDLSRANLSRVSLFRSQALDTNFTGANFTEACIEDWNINSETKLDEVQCDYIYLKEGYRERRPSDPNRNFEPGEFTKLFQKALNTVDLIFRNGVDWQALLISLEKLRVEAAGAALSIQAIENKNDGAFVVRVNTPPEADKKEVERFLYQEYEVALKVLDEKYRYELKAKDIEIESYRRENTNLAEIARLMASRPINVEARATAESQSMAERNINTGGGSYYETINTGGGNYIQGNYINMSQDLTEAAAQIQELLNQLQKNGVTVEVAQEQAATDLANQAKSNPTVMGKLVGWGQAMANKASETTISEAAKAIGPLALKLVGIPLP